MVVYVDASGDKDDVVPALKASSPALENMVVVRGTCSQSSAGGKTSVPQIFIDGDHIGGCRELYALETAGHLDGLLAA